MEKGKGLFVTLDDRRKTGLLRRAALLTARAGKRVAMRDLVNAAIDSILASPLEETTSQGSHTETIKFIPTPEVAKALKRAHANSGKPYNAIVNELVIEALQIEVAT